MFKAFTLLLVVVSTLCTTTLATKIFNAAGNLPCDASPCKNGGTCTNKGASFSCKCIEEYKGDTCEVPCEPTCKNGGTVKIVQGLMKCQCPANYTGVTCEDPHPCVFSPCKNGGTCHINGSCFSCKCPPTYKGMICEERLLPCESSPCKNGRTCHNLNYTSFVCECPDKERTCAESCSTPCKNGGTLVITGNSLRCNCTKDFSGVTCEGATCVEAKLDVLYIIDGSGSVELQNFTKVQNFTKELNKKFDIGYSKTRIALIHFSSKNKTRVEFNLGEKNTLGEVNKGVTDMAYLPGSMTATGFALKMARAQVFSGTGGDRPHASNVLLLFTDGKANNATIQISEAKKLKDDGVKIVSVAMGNDATFANFEADLKEMASKDKKDNPLYFKAQFDQLASISDAIIEATCSG